MIDISTLIARADAYKLAAGLSEDKTVSHRVFGDSKKLTSLRKGADITVGRFNAAMEWFDRNWPSSQPAATAAQPQEHPHVPDLQSP